MIAGATARPHKTINTMWTWCLILGTAVVGLLLLMASLQQGWPTGRGTTQGFVQQLAGSLIVGVTFSAFWELRGKRSLKAEIREDFAVTTELSSAGLAGATTDFQNGIDWPQQFADATELDIVVSYANTWRGSVLSLLRDMADRKGARIRLYLPNPENAELVQVLAERFNKTPDYIVNNVQTAAKEFADLRRRGRAKLEIYFRDTQPLFAFYKFDGTFIVSLYTHREQKQNVPTLVCGREGSFYQFFDGELADIRQRSNKQTL
jgi:hypothetical protein